MEIRILGRDLEVSEIGFGCMGMSHAYGTVSTQKEAEELIEKAIDEGCTFFDTAEIYGTNGGWPGHVIKDMEENCKGAAFAHEMQIQFDSKGKDHLETSEEVITEWIGQINTDINK